MELSNKFLHTNIPVSSAERNKLAKLDIFTTLLMDIRNISSPRIEPYGTPHVICMRFRTSRNKINIFVY